MAICTLLCQNYLVLVFDEVLTMVDPEDIQNLVQAIVNNYLSEYWDALLNLITKDSETMAHFPYYVANPSKIILYLGKTHLAIEYIDNGEKTSSTDLQIEVREYLDEQDLFQHIVSFQYDGNANIKFPLVQVVEHILAPTLKAEEILFNSGWDLDAQMRHQSSAFFLNIRGFEFVPHQFASLRDCMFYGTDKSGLIVRHVKWLDVFPIEVIDDPTSSEKQIAITKWPHREDLARIAASYRPPELEKSQMEKLVILNRFIELFNTTDVKETAITSFLTKAENRFILQIAFNAKDFFAERKLNWLTDPNREPIKPDFFVTQRNGFSDIVDFKLPTLKHTPIVGTENRETFNAQIHSYVAQVRTYMTYFEDSIHRSHAENTFGIKVRYPQTTIVIGRRSLFDDEVWKEIERSYQDFYIKTYDDIVDSVTGIVYLISN
jgi:hypothetical protein